MKKILLIDGPRFLNKKNIWRQIKRKMPNLGLLSLSAMIEKAGHKVELANDLYSQDINILKKQIKNLKPEIIGISITTVQAKSSYLLLKYLNSEFPNIKIIFGGIHASIFPEEVFSQGKVDCIFNGESELSIIEYLNEQPLYAIKNIIYKKKNKIIINPNYDKYINLDDLPFPAYHLIDLQRFSPSVGSYKHLPAAPVIYSRGCPGRCIFCHNEFFGKKVRMKSPNKIIQEIQILINKFKIKELTFYDDNFTSNHYQTKVLLNLMIQKQLPVTWSCMSRIDTINEEILLLMKKAGCHQVGYGIESANKKILANINKNIDLNKTIKICNLTKKIGINVRGMFMFGNLGENYSTMKETLSFACKLNPSIAIFNIATPYPGTKMFKYLEKKKLLKTRDWDKYDLSNVVYDLPEISGQEIYNFYKKAYRKFYFRIKYLYNIIKMIKNFKDLINLLKAGWAVFSFLFFQFKNKPNKYK